MTDRVTRAAIAVARRALYDALSDNWEIDADGYDQAARAVVEALAAGPESGPRAPQPDAVRLAEHAANSVAAGRWTSRNGIAGWYVEDGTGRVVCTAADGPVAAHIAANDPAAVLAVAAGQVDPTPAPDPAEPPSELTGPIPDALGEPTESRKGWGWRRPDDEDLQRSGRVRAQPPDGGAMTADSGTQYAGLTPDEALLAATDPHMSGCDAPTVLECGACRWRLATIRNHLEALTVAGRVLPEPEETREGWGYQHPHGGPIIEAGTEERARSCQRVGGGTTYRRDEQDLGDGRTLLGSWVPVDTDAPKAKTADDRASRWYVMHDHGPGTERHIHSTAQTHMGDVGNPRANDHAGVATVATLDDARAVLGADTPVRSTGAT